MGSISYRYVAVSRRVANEFAQPYWTWTLVVLKNIDVKKDQHNKAVTFHSGSPRLVM